MVTDEKRRIYNINLWSQIPIEGNKEWSATAVGADTLQRPLFLFDWNGGRLPLSNGNPYCDPWQQRHRTKKQNKTKERRQSNKTNSKFESEIKQ